MYFILAFLTLQAHRKDNTSFYYLFIFKKDCQSLTFSKSSCKKREDNRRRNRIPVVEREGEVIGPTGRTKEHPLHLTTDPNDLSGTFQDNQVWINSRPFGWALQLGSIRQWAVQPYQPYTRPKPQSEVRSNCQRGGQSRSVDVWVNWLSVEHPCRCWAYGPWGQGDSSDVRAVVQLGASYFSSVCCLRMRIEAQPIRGFSKW